MIIKIGKRAFARKLNQPFAINYIFLPFIRLSGKYLKNAGFEIGDELFVKIENDCIILKKLSSCDSSDFLKKAA